MSNPQRMCIACRTSKDKHMLARIVVIEGVAHCDKSGVEQARGMYVCKDCNCLDKLKKFKNSVRRLGFEITQELIAQLEETIE